MNLQTTDDIARLIEGDPWRMRVLKTVAALNLPDWVIGAGFVRAAVWDALAKKEQPTLLSDVDVLYFDNSTTDAERDDLMESVLTTRMPDVPWSVKNQARMHLRNNDRPYINTEDALRFWLETPTAVAVRLNDTSTLTVIAPFGIGDLLSMRIRPTPHGLAKIDQYRARIQAKDWMVQWPGIIVEGMEDREDS